MSSRMKKEHGKKLRKGFRKTVIDRKVWLLDDPHEVEMSKEKIAFYQLYMNNNSYNNIL
jgi:hypothetical protein